MSIPYLYGVFPFADVQSGERVCAHQPHDVVREHHTRTPVGARRARHERADSRDVLRNIRREFTAKYHDAPQSCTSFLM